MKTCSGVCAVSVSARPHLVAALALLGQAVGCGEDATPQDTACDLDYQLTWDTFGDAFFHTWCAACHSADTPDRFDAPEEYNFDTEDEVRHWEDRIRARVLDEQTMPLGGGISEQERALLQQYLDCGL